VQPFEQAAAEVVFEDADLPAERGAGHAQLAGGFLEAEMPRRRLEGDDAVGRRQSEQSGTHKEILIEKKDFYQFTVVIAIGTLRLNRDGSRGRRSGLVTRTRGADAFDDAAYGVVRHSTLSFDRMAPRGGRVGAAPCRRFNRYRAALCAKHAPDSSPASLGCSASARRREKSHDSATAVSETEMTELEYWTQQIKKGRINRREFMGRAALGVTTALATSMLAGAGVAQRQKAARQVRLGAWRHNRPLDPANYPDTGTQVPFWGSMSNSLTEVDADGNVNPISRRPWSRATTPSSGSSSCARARHSTTARPHCRRRDRLHRHHMGEESKSVAKSILAPITELKADGKDTVILTRRVPTPISPSRPATTTFRSCRRRTTARRLAVGRADRSVRVRILGTGVRAKLKRFPNYHRNGLPYFDEVEFLTIADVVAPATRSSPARCTGSAVPISRR
jgi:hypothetical protein